MRGFFQRADGLILPNNVTTYGAQRILEFAFRAAEGEFWLGLVNCVPDAAIQSQDLGEPTLGIGGYARQQVTRDVEGWLNLGQLNDEPYIESRWITFPATDAYSGDVNRVALFDNESNLFGDGVIALGSAWIPSTLFDENTAENLRTFRYRLFLR